MRLLVVAFLLAGVGLAGAPRKQRQLAIQVVEAIAHRTHEGVITLDGCVRNTGRRQIEGLVIVFDFMASGGSVITTQKFEAEEAVLESGKDAIYRAQINDHVRAVKYRVSAVDKSGRHLHVTRPGPYVID